MKQNQIIALIVALVGGLLFASTAVSAPMQQTATPTPTPMLAVDWENYKECEVTSTGYGVVNRCTLTWDNDLNTRYPYTTTRFIGLYFEVLASDYLENYGGGPAQTTWYSYTKPGDWFTTMVSRQRVTVQDNPDFYGYWYWQHPNPSNPGCPGFSSLGLNCDAVWGNGVKPYNNFNVMWPVLNFEMYNQVWDTAANPPEGVPQATINFRAYPVVIIYSGGGLPPTPTASPSPSPTTGTPVYATQLPFPTEICITATTSAATPTPFYSGSATPTATTGATATATPEGTYEPPSTPPTATPGAADIYVSDVWEFDQSLSPWTKVSVFQFPAPVEASWTGETGPDGISGTVRLTYNALSRPVTSTIAPAGGIVWTRGSNIPAPLYLKASVKSDGIFAGTYNFLVLHVKDMRGYWAVHSFELIGTGWREITFYTAEFDPYTAIGLAAYSCNSPDWNTCTPKAYSDGTTAGTLVDNVQILAGSYANTLATRPCPESGSDNEYRVCRLYINTIDVGAVCGAPDDWLNVGGWLSWLGCRIEKYFAFDQIVNGAQLQSMYTFGYTQEPLGSAADLAILIQEGRDSFEQARAEQPGTFSVPDMDVFFSTGGLEPIVLTVPSHDDDYLIQCPAQFNTVNEGIRKGLCFSIYAIKTQPASYVFIQAINWLANLASFLFLLGIVRMSIQETSK